LLLNVREVKLTITNAAEKQVWMCTCTSAFVKDGGEGVGAFKPLWVLKFFSLW